MSETSGGPPNYFAPPSAKGRGIRRLNRTPVLLLGGVAVLIVSGLGYTLFEREAAVHAHRGGQGSQAPTGPASASGALANAPSGVIPPAQTAGVTPTPIAAAAPSTLVGGAGGPQTPAQLAASQRAALMDQEVADVERNRLNSEAAALSADSSVQLTTVATSATPATSVAANPGALPPFLGGAGSTSENSADPNGQSEKAAFLNQPPTVSDYLPTTRENAASPFEIRAGTVIPAVMVGGINSDLPGQILGQVSENVYDTATGHYLLIPQGAKLVGTYDNHVTFGQSRVLVIWNRIIFPDGSSLDINSMPGADQGGYSGFYDQVDNHYVKIFGSALLLSLFSAGIQLSQPQPSANSSSVYTDQQVVAGAVGQQLGQAGMAMIQRNLDIQPTLTVRPGYLFNVMVTKDIVVKTYGAAGG